MADETPPPQPFYTSKAFWTALVGLVFYILVALKVLPVTLDGTVIAGMILAVLAGVFRWTADQPLTTKSSGSTTADGKTVQVLP